jgi:hypothetical protein
LFSVEGVGAGREHGDRPGLVFDVFGGHGSLG